MNPSDRKLIGKAAATPEECKAKAEDKLERQEQRTFAGLLRQRMERGELIFDWSRTDKKVTNTLGRADFWIAANNRFLQIEFKAYAGKLSEEQKDMRAWSEACGCAYHIVFSAEEGHRLLMQWLEQPKSRL